MHTFTLSDDAGRHLGFMAFLPEEGNSSGSCMFRLCPNNADDSALLHRLEQYTDQSLRWCREGSGLALYGENGTYFARLDGQYLDLGGQCLILSDLEGNL